MHISDFPTIQTYAYEDWFKDSGCTIPLLDDSPLLIELDRGYLKQVRSIQSLTSDLHDHGRTWPSSRYSAGYYINPHLVRLNESNENWETMRIKKIVFYIPYGGGYLEPKETVLYACCISSIAYAPGRYQFSYPGLMHESTLLQITLSFVDSCSLDLAEKVQMQMISLLYVGLRSSGSPLNTVYYTENNNKIYQLNVARLSNRNFCYIEKNNLVHALPGLLDAFGIWLHHENLNSWRHMVETSSPFKFSNLMTWLPDEDHMSSWKNVFDSSFDCFESVLRSIAEDKRFMNITDNLHYVDACSPSTIKYINNIMPLDAQEYLFRHMPLDDKNAKKATTELNKFLRILSMLRNKSHHSFLANAVQCDRVSLLDINLVQKATLFLNHVSWAIIIVEILKQSDMALYAFKTEDDT